MIEFTKAQVAELLDVNERSVTTYQNRDVDPLPVYQRGKRGTSNIYCAKQVHEWDKRQQMAKFTFGENGEVLDYEAERARLTHHQANKTEMEAAVMRGDLIPADIVQQVQADMVGRCRARLLAIPTKAAHQMLGLDDLSEAQDVLKQNIYEALRELADYRPEHYGIDTAASLNHTEE